MKRITLLCSVVAMTALMFCGCGNSGQAEPVLNEAEPSASPTQTTSPEPSPEPTEDLTNKAVNSLSGLYVDKDAASRRPVAVVINNRHVAKPQSGIAQADIMYEVLAEGDITRMVAIYRDFNTKRIGSVRSNRHYFLDFALDHDAIFVHHGSSEQGYSEIRRLGIDNLDGMVEAAAFWRDPERSKVPSMYEHSSYTSAENILTTAEAKGYRMEADTEADTPFDFYDEQTQPENGQRVIELMVPYSPNYVRRFMYDPAIHKYYVFQGDDPHIDEEIGEQLTYTNVIVQFVNMYVMAGDEYGHREVDLVGSGDGLLFTNGAVVPISWQKSVHKEPAQWFGEDGEKLELNKGNTWINVYMGDVDMRMEVDLHTQENMEEE